MKVLVSGAVGFVGRAMCRALHARGDQVRALVKERASESARVALSRIPVEIHAGDVHNEAAIEAAARGVDVVIHASSHSMFRGTLREHEAANLIGTENALAACRRAGVRRFVFVSSELVTAGNYKRDYIDETFPQADDFLSPFAQTVALAEDLVIAANDREMECVAIRPGWTWGPDDNEFLPEMLRRSRAGTLTLYGGASVNAPTTYITNLVRALELAASKPAAAGNLYFVTDDERISCRAFLGKLLVAVGGRAPRRTMPYALGYTLAWLAEKASSDPSLTRADVVRFGRTSLFNLKKIREELGYEPEVRIDDGMRHLSGWAVSVGGLDAIASGSVLDASSLGETPAARGSSPVP